jgi:hypothetical protein
MESMSAHAKAVAEELGIELIVEFRSNSMETSMAGC